MVDFNQFNAQQYNDTSDRETPDTSENILHTDVAEVMLVPKVSETSAFQVVLQEIPVKVSAANELLKSYREDPKAFIETIDEDELDAVLKNMASVSTFVRGVDKSRKDIVKFFNNVKDTVINELDERLDGAQFGELERAQADIKQLKKDVDADRRAIRWDEIRATFQANIDRYPTISEFAPELTDFSRFKILHPKLISGAKTRKVKESDHTTVNETVYAWNTAIELIKENEWALTPQDQNQLLTLFKQNPSIEVVQREGRQIKINAEAREKARIEAEKRQAEAAERARIEAEKRQAELLQIQERERLAKAQRDKDAEAEAVKARAALEERSRLAAEQERLRKAEYQQFGGQYQTIFKESFPKFIKYLFDNKNYHDVHSSAQTKAAVIYDIMQQVPQPDSIVTQETSRDPQKVLDLVRFILDA